MSLCHSIDTLAMAFLDDELAGEERRELELHLLDCASCRLHVESERADISLVRKALVVPPASAMLKARISRALDAEDAEAARRERRRWSQWVLPGSAICAAAAAILLFVGVGAPLSGQGSSVIVDVARQQNHMPPLEVLGASTGPLVRRTVQVEPPRFTEPGIDLEGGRLLPNGIGNHDAVLLQYVVTLGSERFNLTTFLIKDLRGDELSGGQGYRVNGGLVLRVHDADGIPVVTYVDPRDHVGYVFASERMTPGELLRLVSSTDLIARAQQAR